MNAKNVLSSPLRYLDKALNGLRDLGLLPQKPDEMPVITLINQISDLDEEKTIAIARTLSNTTIFNEVVREQITSMNVGQRYETITKAFDSIRDDAKSMVEQLVDYKENRADYHMLNELPVRLREHADQAAEESKRQQQALQVLERQAAEKDGVGTLQSALDKAELQLQQVNDEIEAHEKRYQELLEQKADFAAGEDEYTQKAVEVLLAELEREDTIELYRQAQATPRPEDDAIVMQLHKLQQEQQETNKRISELKADRQQQRKALEELTNLRGKFRRSNYDAGYSSFPSKLGLGMLLGEMLRGGRSSGSTWGRIGDAQKWDLPDLGGIGDSGGGGGFGGFGGFGSGGGFGGGGFRTGGGF